MSFIDKLYEVEKKGIARRARRTANRMPHTLEMTEHIVSAVKTKALHNAKFDSGHTITGFYGGYPPYYDIYSNADISFVHNFAIDLNEHLSDIEGLNEICDKVKAQLHEVGFHNIDIEVFSKPLTSPVELATLSKGDIWCSFYPAFSDDDCCSEMKQYFIHVQCAW